MNKLLASVNCEKKAIALSILGSLCGLSSYKMRSKNQKKQGQGYYGEDVYGDDDWEERDANISSYEEDIMHANGGGGLYNPNFCTERKINIKEHLHLLRDKASFVSLAIW